jgi:hypothetical protein
VDRAVISVLLVGIGLPLAGTALGLDLMPEGNEMRRRAVFPRVEANWRSLKSLPGRFEDFFNDHFGFRGPLIRGLSLAKVRVLAASTSTNVHVGREGWLYYTNEQPGADYDKVRPFTQEELERWARILARRQAWLEQRHCRYLLLIPPDKQTIYPEHANPSLRARHAQGRLDQLLDYLRGHPCGVPVLDVRKELRQAREREVLYYIADSHWNTRGAFVGYEALAEALASWFPQIRPLRREQCKEVLRPGRGGDLAGLLDLRDFYVELAVQWLPKLSWHWSLSPFPVEPPRNVYMPFGPPAALENHDTALPRAVLFHDSFALELLPFLGEHFQRMVTVWLDDFNQEMVEREHPDVVIQELLERKLGHVVPNDIQDDGH